MKAAPATVMSSNGYDADFTWGVILTPGCTDSRRRLRAASGRRAMNLLAALTMTLAALLGIAGISLSATSPARADIFGISDAVENWLCGVVAPEEPWEAVGDGPESWLPNHNLAQVAEAPVAQVGSNAAGITTRPGRPGVPDTTDAIRSLPKGQYTLYEVAGLRGLSWWTVPLNVDKSRNCSLWNYIWTQGANLLFTVDKNLLQVVIALKEEAAKPQPLQFLYNVSGGVMNNMFVFFFIPIAMLSLLASAIWVGIKSARGKANIRGMFSIMATGFAIVLLMALLYTVSTGGKAGFRAAAEGVDSTISFLNATGTSAILDGLTGNQGTCVLDKTIDPVQRGQRLTSCVLADSLAYRPWEVGQFGSAGANPIPLPSGWSVSTPAADGKVDVRAITAGHTLPCWVDFNSCSDLRTYLIAQHGGVELNSALSGQQGNLVCSVDSLKSAVATVSSPEDLKNLISATANCSPMYDVFLALSESDPTTAAIYAGQGSVSRVSQAFTALLAIILVCIAVLVTAVISMGWEAMTFAYFLIGPIKNAFALYAGKMKMTRDWLEDLGYSYVLRLAYGFVLAIMIVIIVWMMDSTQNFGMRLFWLAIILLGFWKIIQKVQAKLRPGVSSMAPDIAKHVTDHAEKVGRFSGRHVVQAAPAGVKSIRATRERRRIQSATTSHGPARRKISTFTAPLSYAGSGLRGAVTGSASAAEARTAKVSARHPIPAGNGRPPGKPSAADVPHPPKNPPTLVKTKDPASSEASPARRPIPTADPAASTTAHDPAAAQPVSAHDATPPAPEPVSSTGVPQPSTTKPATGSKATGSKPDSAPSGASAAEAPPGLPGRVIRPVVTPRTSRPRLPAGGSGVQRPRMRAGGSLGLAAAARTPSPPTKAESVPAAAPSVLKSPNQSPQTKDPRLTTPSTTPPRPRPAPPEPPPGPMRVDPANEPPPPQPDPTPTPVSPQPPQSMPKSHASKGNSDTGAIARQAKAQPGKGGVVRRPTTTSRSQ